MANAIYPKFKEAAFKGAANVDLTGGTIKVSLVDLADYAYSASHQYISDVPGAARVATATLSGMTMVNGLFDANDVTFVGVTGDQSEALIIWKDTGVEATSRLICYLDTGVTGLPITPSGGDIAIAWNASGIFQD